MIKFNEEEDSRDDFFTTEHTARPPKEKKPREPKLRPDDPAYWDRPESDWEFLKVRPNRRIWIWVAVAGIVAGLLWAAYIRVFTPFVDQATQCGYVEDIQRHKSLFTTYEGVILPYKELMDTTRVYRSDFTFSAADAKVATDLKRMEYAHMPVRVHYKVYRMALPWRGESKVVVTAVDSVDPRRILPPEFAPEWTGETTESTDNQ